MKRTFTQDDVIQFVYGELTEEEGMKLLAEMKGNEELGNFYNETLETLAALPMISVGPNPTSVNIVLEESQSSTLEIF